MDARRVAVIRELFEETGILLARTTQGELISSTPDWQAQRQALIEEKLSFAAFLSEHELTLLYEDLLSVGSLVTPPFSPLRFDTAFFVAHLPPGQRPSVWPGELDSGFWTTAEDVLTRWSRGESLISPPTVSMLQLLVNRPIEDLPVQMRPLLDKLDSGAIPPIPFAPEVWLIPLQTVGLPPSNYTNAYLVGTDPCWLIDPGCKDPEEQQRLFGLLDTAQGRGQKLRGILLTHHHPDHVDAANVCASRYSVPIYGHPNTAERLKGRVQVTHLLHEGDRIELGQAPDGSGDWHLEVLFVPGHASGHVVFWEPKYRLLFGGDLISMLSSVVIAPPDGNLTQYLQSLHRLRELDCRMLFPGHGNPTTKAREVMDKCLHHRARREEQLLGCLEDRSQSVEALTEKIYQRLIPELMPLARLQVLAGLQKLEHDGKAIGERESHWKRA